MWVIRVKLQEWQMIYSWFTKDYELESCCVYSEVTPNSYCFLPRSNSQASLCFIVIMCHHVASDFQGPSQGLWAMRRILGVSLPSPTMPSVCFWGELGFKSRSSESCPSFCPPHCPPFCPPHWFPLCWIDYTVKLLTVWIVEIYGTFWT